MREQSLIGKLDAMKRWWHLGQLVKQWNTIDCSMATRKK
jgi:hypothetical protein